MLSAGLADHSAVLGERGRVRLGAELVEQPRRALDVREQEVTVPEGIPARMR